MDKAEYKKESIRNGKKVVEVLEYCNRCVNQVTRNEAGLYRLATLLVVALGFLLLVIVGDLPVIFIIIALVAIPVLAWELSNRGARQERSTRSPYSNDQKNLLNHTLQTTRNDMRHTHKNRLNHTLQTTKSEIRKKNKRLLNHTLQEKNDEKKEISSVCKICGGTTRPGDKWCMECGADLLQQKHIA